jgi:calcium binding protein 39
LESESLLKFENQNAVRAVANTKVTMVLVGLLVRVESPDKSTRTTVNMTDSNFGSANKASTNAFEWLAGGLFFGPGKQTKGTIKSIDSCKDVQILLEGVNESLQEVISSTTSRSGAAAAAVVAPPAVAVSATPVETTGDMPPAQQQPTAAEFLAARLARLRFLLYDERRISSQQWEMSSSSSSRRSNPVVAAATLQGLVSSDSKLQAGNLMPQMLENLHILPFESRKVVAHIFNYLLAAGLDGADAPLYYAITEGFRDYVYSKCDIFLTIIVNGLGSCHHGVTTDVALHCGSMYRSFLRHPVLYQQIVGSTERATKYVFPFLDDYVHLPDFDVSSDAMECLRMILIAGWCGDRVVPDERAQQTMAELAAEFMTRDYEELFDLRFNPKLLSPDTANYMTRRVALQILSTVLLTRSNYNVMVRFVASKLNLILIMQLLRDTSPHITLDAFHVFKVFVANPNKPPEVVKILKDNQIKLCAYLATLHQDKAASDAQFRDEKALIIATIEAL